MKNRSNIVLVLLLLVICASGQGLAIPAVPDYLLPEQKQALNKQYILLTEKRTQLTEKINRFNAKCTAQDIPENNTQLINECTAEKAAIANDKSALRTEIDNYNKQISSDKLVTKTVLQKRTDELNKKIDSDKVAISNAGPDKAKQKVLTQTMENHVKELNKAKIDLENIMKDNN